MRSTDKFVPYKNSSLRKLGKVHAIDNKLRTKEKFQRLTPACLRFSNFIVFLQLAVFLTNSTNKFVPSLNSFLPFLVKLKSFKIDKGKVKEVIVSLCSSHISQHKIVDMFHESQGLLVSVNQRQRVFLRVDG